MKESARFNFGCVMLIFVAASFSAVPAFSQDLPAGARIAATAWLFKDCRVGETYRLSDTLVKYKTQLEPFFLAALSNGPDSKSIADVESGASKRFEALQELLKTGSGTGLSQMDLQEARKITRDQYLTREKGNFVDSYKSRAVAALGVVAGEKGQAALRAILQDSNSPYYETAQEALKRLQSRR